MTSAVTLDPEIAGLLRNSTDHIVVTGATGWLGQAFLHALAEALGNSSRLHAFASRENALILGDGTSLPIAPLPSLGELPKQHYYWLFHFAFLTKDKQSTMSPTEYVERNHGIRAQISSFLTSHHVSGLCVTSSGAVYTKERQLNRDLEAYPYAALKVEEEEYFSHICRARIPLIIPRIFNMSGPYINKWTAYALASLLAMAMRGEKLVINARHPVIRSYAYIGDIINVLLNWLLKSASPEALIFDVCTAETVEIGELANYICKTTGRSVNDILRGFDPTLPADRYLGDPETFLHLCSAYGVEPLSLKAQIEITRNYMEGLILKDKSSLTG